MVALPQLKLDDFRLSHRQKREPNPDLTDWDWRQIYFWTEGVRLLGHTGYVCEQVKELDPGAQEQFWQGVVPERFLEHLPSAIVGRASSQIVDYCKVWQSQHRAFSLLCSKARREKVNPNGTVSVGGVHLDEKCYALRLAELDKSVNNHTGMHVIGEAAKCNDVRFFIQLGRALQKRRKPLEVDWSRCDPLACFLVANWCEAAHFWSGLPLLCFFTDQALADFCSVAFGRKAGSPTAEAVRQWRKRLGLRRPQSPKIRKVTVEKDEILFA